MSNAGKDYDEEQALLPTWEQVTADWTTVRLEVPGGWIYKMFEWDTHKDVPVMQSTCFVPKGNTNDE
jgi:hypothetical protein